MTSKEARIYDIIDKKAGSNIAMQGLSGVLGFPFTLVADVGVFFTHYGPMLNEIRAVYGRKPMSKDVFAPVIKGCSSEIMTDMVVDKVLGNIPLIGLPANMICAKAMTWRLGIMFGMLAARGEEINTQSVADTTRLIRELFPQKNTFQFKKPSVTIVEKLLNTMEGETVQDYDQKVMAILNGLQTM